jgi:hypothetical protein
LQQSDTEEAAKTQILAHNLNMLADKACAFFFREVVAMGDITHVHTNVLLSICFCSHSGLILKATLSPHTHYSIESFIRMAIYLSPVTTFSHAVTHKCVYIKGNFSDRLAFLFEQKQKFLFNCGSSGVKWEGKKIHKALLCTRWWRLQG